MGKIGAVMIRLALGTALHCGGAVEKNEKRAADALPSDSVSLVPPCGPNAEEGEPSCVNAAICGNGLPEWGEECDDGNPNYEDCCTPECQKIPDGACCGNQSGCKDGACTELIPEICDHIDNDCDGKTDEGFESSDQCGPLPPPESLEAGTMHTCAVLQDETVWCWGWNWYGQIGDGTTIDRATPILVAGLSGVAAVALGVGHTCALTNDGKAKCWGNNWDNKLGDGSYEDQYAPVPVAGLAGAIALASGNGHTCALMPQGEVQCWGRNFEGELGDGTLEIRDTPVFVQGLAHAAAITIGAFHTCALLGDHTVVCWGNNEYGELGDGTTETRPFPLPVAGIQEVAAISAGGNHTCALLKDGTARCWGHNLYGGLGDGTLEERHTPVPVAGLSGVAAIVAGWDHTCAILENSTVACWGYNASGQLGYETSPNYLSLLPNPVTGFSGVEAIIAGANHTCALLTYDMALCWGANYYGQVGNGTFADQSSPTKVKL